MVVSGGGSEPDVLNPISLVSTLSNGLPNHDLPVSLNDLLREVSADIEAHQNEAIQEIEAKSGTNDTRPPRLGRPIAVTCRMAKTKDWSAVGKDHSTIQSGSVQFGSLARDVIAEGKISYVQYNIAVSLHHWDEAANSYESIHNYEIQRRYRDFSSLYTALNESLPNIPPLPNKTIQKNTDPDFLLQRQVRLGEFLSDVAQRRDVLCHPSFREFLEVSPAWSAYLKEKEQHSACTKTPRSMETSNNIVDLPCTKDASLDPIHIGTVQEPTYALDHFVVHPRGDFIVTAASDASKLSQLDGFITKALKVIPSIWNPTGHNTAQHSSSNEQTGRIALWVSTNPDPNRQWSSPSAPRLPLIPINDRNLRAQKQRPSSGESISLGSLMQRYQVVWFEVCKSHVTSMCLIKSCDAVIVGFADGTVIWLPAGDVVSTMKHDKANPGAQRTQLAGKRLSHSMSGTEASCFDFTQHCDRIVSIDFNPRTASVMIISRDGAACLYELIDRGGEFIAMRTTWQTAIEGPIAKSIWDHQSSGMVLVALTSGAVEAYRLRNTGMTRLCHFQSPLAPGNNLSYASPFESSPHEHEITAMRLIPGWYSSEMISPTQDEDLANGQPDVTDCALDRSLLVLGDRSGNISTWIASAPYSAVGRRRATTADSDDSNKRPTIAEETEDDLDSQDEKGICASSGPSLGDVFLPSGEPSLPSSNFQWPTIGTGLPTFSASVDAGATLTRKAFGRSSDSLKYKASLGFEDQMPMRSCSSSLICDQVLPNAVQRYAMSIEVNPHTREIYVGCRSGSIHVLDADTGSPTYSMPAHSKVASADAPLSQGNKKVADVMLGRANGVTQIRLFDVYQSDDPSMIQHPTERMLWASGRDGALRVWRIPAYLHPFEMKLRRYQAEKLRRPSSPGYMLSSQTHRRTMESSGVEDSTTLPWLLHIQDPIEGSTAFNYGLNLQRCWIDSDKAQIIDFESNAIARISGEENAYLRRREDIIATLDVPLPDTEADHRPHGEISNELSQWFKPRLTDTRLSQDPIDPMWNRCPTHSNDFPIP